jgi:hypothetical protein
MENFKGTQIFLEPKGQAVGPSWHSPWLQLRKIKSWQSSHAKVPELYTDLWPYKIANCILILVPCCKKINTCDLLMRSAYLPSSDDLMISFTADTSWWMKICLLSLLCTYTLNKPDEIVWCSRFPSEVCFLIPHCPQSGLPTHSHGTWENRRYESYEIKNI